jgi:hypothetical protein
VFAVLQKKYKTDGALLERLYPYNTFKILLYAFGIMLSNSSGKNWRDMALPILAAPDIVFFLAAEGFCRYTALREISWEVTHMFQDGIAFFVL